MRECQVVTSRPHTRMLSSGGKTKVRGSKYVRCTKAKTHSPTYATHSPNALLRRLGMGGHHKMHGMGGHRKMHGMGGHHKMHGSGHHKMHGSGHHKMHSMGGYIKMH